MQSKAKQMKGEQTGGEGVEVNPYLARQIIVDDKNAVRGNKLGEHCWRQKGQE